MTPYEPEPPPLPTYHQPPVPWWPIAAVAAAVVAIVVGMTVQVPYIAEAPGGSAAVNSLVHVKGGPSYEPKGEIDFVTVSLRHPTIIEAIQGWLDPTVDVVPQKRLLGKDVTPSKYHQLSLEAMATSKQKAVAVAFEQLGYTVIKGQGAQVIDVVKHTPADGLLHRGDVIQAVDRQPTDLDSDAVRVLRAHAPGDTVTLTVLSKGASATHDETVTLTKNPDVPKRAFLGVQLGTYKARFDPPYDVDIQLDTVGGPSAGLAFTLEVLDTLTEGEITGGHHIAVTGEIALDGSVLPIGGVAQKTVAVKRTGAEVFLVPRSEAKQARKFAGKHLRVEPVRNVRDALRILASLGGNGLALDRPGEVPS